MKFASVQKDVRTLLTSGFYRVPRFQRPYSWTTEELDEFWTDAVVEGGPGYFIGSIVLFTEEPGFFGIVDGQQRLTTVTMLLCGLRDAFASAGFDDLAGGLHTMIERPDVKSLPQYVIQPDATHKYFEEFIQKREEPDLEAQPGEEQRHLEAAFAYVCEKLDTEIGAIKSDDSLNTKQRRTKIKNRLEEMRDTLLGLSLILVELDDEDDACLIFETLNARGKNLRVSDLVKSHLTRCLKQQTKTVDTVRERWNRVLETIEGASASISVDGFIHHHWLSTHEYVSQKKLYKAIKTSVKKPTAGDYLDTLVDESQLYRSIFEPRLSRWDKPEAGIRDSLSALGTFQVRQPTPFVLSLLACLRDGTLKARHVADALNAVEVFHYLFTAITSQSSSGGISQMYALHARTVRQAETEQGKVRTIRDLKGKLRDRLPTYEEFEPAFSELSYSKDYTRDRKLVRYTLGRLARNGLKSNVLDYEQMTIEHIAPQSSTTIDAEWIASIGNLILVGDDLNEKLANKNFATKKPQLEDAADVWVDDALADADGWGTDEIGERATKLAEIAYERIWRI